MDTKRNPRGARKAEPQADVFCIWKISSDQSSVVQCEESIHVEYIGESVTIITWGIRNLTPKPGQGLTYKHLCHVYDQNIAASLRRFYVLVILGCVHHLYLKELLS